MKNDSLYIEKTIMDQESVKILITGDFCPINRVETLALREDYDSIFNDFIDILRDNDLLITDLESPLTNSTHARIKYGPHQKAHPACVKILKHAGIGLVALANNHIMDYDAEGVTETLELCLNSDISTVGVGRDAEEAGKPYSCEIKNKRIAVLNYADNEFITTTDGSYVGNTIDPVKCYYDLRDLREGYDFVIAIIHAGNELYNLPSPRTKKLYRYLVDQGADVVVAHHTHAFSGYEIYKSKLIFYGLGNFIYDWPGRNNMSWNFGYAVKLEISNRIDFKVIPHKQGNKEPGVFCLNTEELTAFDREINRLGKIISDDDFLESAFNHYCATVFPMYEAFLEPHFGRFVASLRKRRLFPRFISRRKKLLLLNLIRCESHRDVMIRMLKRCE